MTNACQQNHHLVMKNIFILLFIFFTFSTFGSVYQGEVVKIDYPQSNENDILIFLIDGKILKTDDDDTKKVSELEKAKRNKSLIQFSTSLDRKITHFYEIERKVERKRNFKSSALEFTPTVLPGLDAAKTIFKSFRGRPNSWSQCYNRAHVWAFESKKQFQLDSMKVFIFYTRKYIREYNFDWWFHVAPFTLIQAGDSTEERVLDPRYAKSPLKFKEWTDLFMRNKVTCPVIKKYSDYENNEEASYCYLLMESMYYLQPLDLDNLERYGVVKSQWLNYEIRRAYRNGFDIW